MSGTLLLSSYLVSFGRWEELGGRNGRNLEELRRGVKRSCKEVGEGAVRSLEEVGGGVGSR